MRRASMFVLLLGTTALTGCATIANGPYQQVPIVSNPAGATVVSDCGRGPVTVGETPTVAKLSRKADRCVLTLRKDGYVGRSVVLTRHVSGWLWGNLFLPHVAIPGILVDLFDGSAYRKAPASVRLSLLQERASLVSPNAP